MSLNSRSEDFVPSSCIKWAVILQTVLLTIKMVRFLGVTSLLLFSYSVLVAASAFPREPSAETNDVGAMLLGRARTCTGGSSEPYDIPLNQLCYSPYAQVSALITSGAATQAPSVATTGMVDVRACFNNRLLPVLLTTPPPPPRL